MNEKLFVVMQDGRPTLYVGYTEIEAIREAIHESRFLGILGDGTTKVEWKKMQKYGYYVREWIPKPHKEKP